MSFTFNSLSVNALMQQTTTKGERMKRKSLIKTQSEAYIHAQSLVVRTSQYYTGCPESNVYVLHII